MKFTQTQLMLLKAIHESHDLLRAAQISEISGVHIKTSFNVLKILCEQNIIEKLDNLTYCFTDFGQNAYKTSELVGVSDKSNVSVSDKNNKKSEKTRETVSEPSPISIQTQPETQQTKSDVKEIQTLEFKDARLLDFGKNPITPRASIPINEKTVAEIKNHINNETPAHYQGKAMQVFDVLENFLTSEELNGFYVGNVVKYVLRYKGKGGRDDLRKAAHYLDKLMGN